MIDTDKYESVIYKVTVFLEDNEQYGDDWSKERRELKDLLADVKRLKKDVQHQIESKAVLVKALRTEQSLRHTAVNQAVDYCAQLEETKKQLAQAEGATQMALQHLGLQGADHDEFCRFKYGCNVYGDELEEEE